MSLSRPKRLMARNSAFFANRYCFGTKFGSKVAVGESNGEFGKSHTSNNDNDSDLGQLSVLRLISLVSTTSRCASPRWNTGNQATMASGVLFFRNLTQIILLVATKIVVTWTGRWFCGNLLTLGNLQGDRLQVLLFWQMIDWCAVLI